MVTGIRVATVEDLPAVLEMGHHFYAQTDYHKWVREDPKFFASMCSMLFEQGRIFVADRGGELVGFLAALVFVHPFMNQKMVTEIMWWVEPAHRGGTSAIRLLRATEAWGRECGAEAIQMGAWIGAHLDPLYERMGFEARETMFQKAL